MESMANLTPDDRDSKRRAIRPLHTGTCMQDHYTQELVCTSWEFDTKPDLHKP